jgi:hypothetical protein
VKNLIIQNGVYIMQSKTKPQFDNMSQADRMDVLRKIRIIHPQFHHIMELIDECRDSIHSSDDPQCGLITGLSGAGKSTIFKMYVQLNDKVIFEETRTKKTILHAEITSPITLLSFLETLLDELGDPFPLRGTKSNKTTRLSKLIVDCGIELILLDEFQHFVHSENNKLNYEVSDCFKSLVNVTKVPVVLFGYEKSNDVINCNPQLKRRFSYKHHLAPFSYETDKSQQEFRVLLRTIDNQLPLVEQSNLENMADAFYYATSGLMDSIMKIIRDATKIAIKEKKERISTEDLAKAYYKHKHLHHVNKVNPFLEKDFSFSINIQPIKD